jgi:5'-3' exonuclease
MDKVLIIDGMNAIHRANVPFDKGKQHFLCAPEEIGEQCVEHLKSNPHCECGASWDENAQTCYGQLYSIVFNFFRNLRPMIEMFEPAKCFFVLEGHSKFRYNLFPDYKGNRIIKTASKTPEENEKFISQRDIIVALLPYLPLTIVKAFDYEGDDIIATLCTCLVDEDVVVLSGDNDFIQLLQIYSNVHIYNPIKKAYLEAPPYPYVAYKCLIGDKSDNIPRLMGEKTSEKLLADPIKFSDWMAIEENRANFSINRQLIEFQIVAPDDIITVEGSGDWESLKAEFSKMEFNSITNDKSWEKYVSTFNCITM